MAPAHSVVFPLDDNWNFFFVLSVMMVLQNGKIPEVASCITA